MSNTQNTQNNQNNQNTKKKNPKAKYEPKNPEKYAAKQALKTVKRARMLASKQATQPTPTPVLGPVFGLSLTEFPSLEDANTVKDVPQGGAKPTPSKRSGEVHTSYIVATSYQTIRPRNYAQKLNERYGKFDKNQQRPYVKRDFRPQESETKVVPRDVPITRAPTSARDQAFANLENKGALTQTLTCTKACKHVVDGTKEVEDSAGQKQVVYGVCYRSVCSFAHSLEELQDPTCTFGDACRYVQHSNVNGRVCRFRHPFETREMYGSRVGVQNPNLPQTAELTRDPRAPRAPRKPRDQPTQDDKIAEVEKALQEFSLIGSIADTQKETVIQVPKEMFEQAMETALKQGMANFRIEVIA